MSGFSSRHAFQAATPCLSNATCSSFAIGASRGADTDIQWDAGAMQGRPEALYGEMRGALTGIEDRLAP